MLVNLPPVGRVVRGQVLAAGGALLAEQRLRPEPDALLVHVSNAGDALDEEVGQRRRQPLQLRPLLHQPKAGVLREMPFGLHVGI